MAATQQQKGHEAHHVHVCKECGHSWGGSRPAKTGGAKGEAIRKVIEAAGAEGLNRKEIAQKAGCTVGRVGEVLRAAPEKFEKTEGGLWRMQAAQKAPARSGTRKAAPKVKDETEQTAEATQPANAVTSLA